MLFSLASSPAAAPICAAWQCAWMNAEIEQTGRAEVRVILRSAEFDPMIERAESAAEIRARASRAEVALRSFVESLPAGQAEVVAFYPDLISVVLRVNRAGLATILHDSRVQAVSAHIVEPE
jgi:hypothetical protein